jgi:hypothetical protein
MIEATRRQFERIWSIELDHALFVRASARFSGRRDRHIRIRQGDSSIVLKEVLAQIEGRALFWLDAHYSGPGTAHGTLETPIRSELELILARRTDRDVILIDDAHAFDGRQYPVLDDFVEELRSHEGVQEVSVADNIIRILTRPSTLERSGDRYAVRGSRPGSSR